MGGVVDPVLAERIITQALLEHSYPCLPSPFPYPFPYPSPTLTLILTRILTLTLILTQEHRLRVMDSAAKSFFCACRDDELTVTNSKKEKFRQFVGLSPRLLPADLLEALRLIAGDGLD
jgi:hypothetical protein